MLPERQAIVIIAVLKAAAVVINLAYVVIMASGSITSLVGSRCSFSIFLLFPPFMEEARVVLLEEFFSGLVFFFH